MQVVNWFQRDTSASLHAVHRVSQSRHLAIQLWIETTIVDIAYQINESHSYKLHNGVVNDS